VKGLAGRAGLFQRRSAFDATQRLLRLAVKTIAGVAAMTLAVACERIGTSGK
jgi:hypothetical protein